MMPSVGQYSIVFLMKKKNINYCLEIREKKVAEFRIYAKFSCKTGPLSRSGQFVSNFFGGFHQTPSTSLDRFLTFFLVDIVSAQLNFKYSPYLYSVTKCSIKVLFVHNI